MLQLVREAFVRETLIRRARDIRPGPSVRGRRVGIVQNRRDEKDYLSSRLIYRRLDTSSISRNFAFNARSACVASILEGIFEILYFIYVALALRQ